MLKIRSRHSLLWSGLVVSACGASEVAPTRAPQPVPSDAAPARELGRFVLQIDPTTGTVTQVGTTSRGIHTRVEVVQDGNPLSNPSDTFQVVTTRARLPGIDGCPGTDNCFDVRVDSFLDREAREVALVVNQVTPARVMSNPDPAPVASGLASPFGITVFGDIAALGSSGLEEMRFIIPTNDPYTVEMTLYETRPAGATLTVASYDTGWYHPGHDPINDSYYVGAGPDGLSLHNFFLFDLTGVVGPINTVILTGPPGLNSGGTGALYRLWDVTTPLDAVQAGGEDEPAISDDLRSGVQFGQLNYSGRLTVLPQNPSPVAFAVTLNSAGREAVRDALGGRIGFGGSYGNDEPSDGAILQTTGNGVGTSATLIINP